MIELLNLISWERLLALWIFWFGLIGSWAAFQVEKIRNREWDNEAKEREAKIREVFERRKAARKEKRLKKYDRN